MSAPVKFALKSTESFPAPNASVVVPAPIAVKISAPELPVILSTAAAGAPVNVRPPELPDASTVATVESNEAVIVSLVEPVTFKVVVLTVSS